jgi:hypothetical protein
MEYVLLVGSELGKSILTTAVSLDEKPNSLVTKPRIRKHLHLSISIDSKVAEWMNRSQVARKPCSRIEGMLLGGVNPYGVVG